MSTSVLRYSGVCNDNRGYEIWHCATTAATATNLITPANLKGIDMVTITPLNAAAATADKGYVTSFVPGDSTVTVTTTTNCLNLVKIEGSIA